MDKKILIVGLLVLLGGCGSEKMCMLDGDGLAFFDANYEILITSHQPKSFDFYINDDYIGNFNTHYSHIESNCSEIGKPCIAIGVYEKTFRLWEIKGKNATLLGKDAINYKDKIKVVYKNTTIEINKSCSIFDWIEI